MKLNRYSSVLTDPTRYHCFVLQFSRLITYGIESYSKMREDAKVFALNDTRYCKLSACKGDEGKIPTNPSLARPIQCSYK